MMSILFLAIDIWMFQQFDEEEDEDDDDGEDDDDSDTNDDELDTDMIDDRDSPEEVQPYILWKTIFNTGEHLMKKYF